MTHWLKKQYNDFYWTVFKSNYVNKNSLADVSYESGKNRARESSRILFVCLQMSCIGIKWISISIRSPTLIHYVFLCWLLYEFEKIFINIKSSYSTYLKIKFLLTQKVLTFKKNNKKTSGQIYLTTVLFINQREMKHQTFNCLEYIRQSKHTATSFKHQDPIYSFIQKP